MQIRDRVALVTGGSSGIGRATAVRLAAEGAAVAVADMAVARGRETVRRIEAAGGRAAFVRSDVALQADARRMVAFAVRTFGRLDILVNNAGVIEGLRDPRLAFPDMAPSRWMRMLDINLRGALLGSHYAIAAMRRRGGAIINISSGGGIGYGPHDAPVYAASKAGVARFSAALAPLGERMGIRVNCICPGWVNTPMSRRTKARLPARAWRARAPASMLQPEEVAAAVVRLVRDERLAGRVLLWYEGERQRLLPR